MKKLLVWLLVFLTLLLTLSIGVGALSEPLPRVVDEADVLTDAEEEALTQRLTAIGDANDHDLVVVITTSIGLASPQTYADDYYDSHGYGKNGVLLLIVINSGSYHISTAGKAIDRFGGRELDDLEEAIVPHLSKGEFYEAFEAYADVCDKVLAFDLVTNLLIAVVIGAVVAFLVLAVMKGQLKSVHRQNNAAGYIRDDSFDLRVSRDIYLYRNITRTRRSSSSSGGGSGVHRSSSGRSHGGRGGRF